MAHNDIVVLGAGIIGLNVTLELSKRGYGRHVTVMAEHLPGDESIDYTSPWAGANFSGISGSDANALRWDRSGYSTMIGLIDAGAEEAKYLSKTESTEYWDQAPSQDKINSMTEYLRDLVIIPSSDLPEGVAFGIKFTTVTLNAPAHCEHLKHLLSQPRYGGVRFVRRKVSRLQDAFLQGTHIVFNCVGNAAFSLAGVTDLKCYPTRGQIVVAKAPSVNVNVMRHGKDYETYIIPRPRSDGTVILGGYLQPRDHTSQARPVETESILSRTAALLPVLKNGETKIIRVAVGLRPSRQGGARVELETTPEGNTVVHNYGAGGTGFQAGMGMAKDAVDLAADILGHLQTHTGSSDGRTNESSVFASLVKPTDSAAMHMTESPMHAEDPSVGEQLFDFSLGQGFDDPHASVLGREDHGIMDELMLSMYEGQGLSHIEPNPGLGPPSLDNHPSLTSQLCGLTGDMDPYVLRHYRFDIRSEFLFSKLAIRSVRNTEVPVQFLLSKPELSNESKSLTSLEPPIPGEGLSGLSQIVTPEIGERLIQLFTRFVNLQFPILSEDRLPDPRASSAHLLAAIYLISQPFTTFDDYLCIELVYSPPSPQDLFRIAWRELNHALSEPTIQSLQAALILLLHPPSNPLLLDSTVKWTLLGMTVSMAQTLGLHLDPSIWNIPSDEIHTRRRLSWVVFAIDKWLAFSFGRPSHISRNDWLITELNSSDIESETSTSGAHLYAIEFSKLTTILDNVLTSL
ncbi:hypothetical protein ETB97_002059 [Aspergillus alliaceus]|uniref:Xylanolytic transcriptional activator regulatory domain-containing protein n=1 Tax=Petromyces alliaceus TaxID=209559 RepID=A0A8H6A667_PETAA|nr:hypothetical protein ETB97_002059 [Aspergillus burnettii]